MRELTRVAAFHVREDQGRPARLFYNSRLAAVAATAAVICSLPALADHSIIGLAPTTN